MVATVRAVDAAAAMKICEQSKVTVIKMRKYVEKDNIPVPR